MSTQLQQAQSRIIKAFTNNIDVLRDVLPSHVSEKTIVRTLAQEMRVNPNLAKCTSVSLFSAVVKACLLGLEVGSIKGHAYLIPFKNECQLIPGYQGYIWLAYNSREVSRLSMHSVHEGDIFFVDQGTDPRIKHTPEQNRREYDNLTHVYAVAKLTNGETLFDWMSKEEVEKIKSKSPGARQKDSPWNDNQAAVEMAKKTVVRRLAKVLPLQVVQELAGLDEKAEREEDQALGALLEGEWEMMDEMEAPAPEPKPKTGAGKAKEALKDKVPDTKNSSPEPSNSEPQTQTPSTSSTPEPAEAMSIELKECETVEDINKFLNRLGDTAGITDNDRELLEKAAHKKKEGIATADIG